MDLATLIGLIGALIVISIAIMLGGDFGAFINIPSIVVAIDGTFAVFLARISLGWFFG
jgi:chemotaxis protein MotA